MANKMVGMLSSFAAALLSLLWFITLVRPWTWVWTDNVFISFKVSLFTVRASKGTLGYGAMAIAGIFGKWKEAKAKMEQLFDHSLWMEEACEKFCMSGVETAFHWCNTWTMVKYGSAVYIFLIFMVILFLSMGSGFTYYYTHVHSTHTGRMWIRVCYTIAPCCAMFGLLQYIMLTFWLGKGEKQLVGETKSNYGLGFVFGCVLTLLTLVPIYLHGVFSKVDEFEKHGDNDVFFEGDVAGGQQGTGMELPAWQQPYPQQPQFAGSYDARQPQFQQPGYPQAPPSGGFGMPPPVPGAGAPAW